MPLCTSCRRRTAQYYRPTSGEKLCLACLFKSIELKVLETIRRENMIVKGDRVGLAISGGKDSLALLYILGKLRTSGRLDRGVELIAFSINEGQPYSCIVRMGNAKFVRDLASKFNVKYVVYTFKDLFGVTAFEILERVRSKGLRIHACTICGVLRRRAMNIIGRELGLTKIATGHNLDDEAQTVLLNVIQGNLSRFYWLNSAESSEEKSLIPRVKPLKYIREEEIAVYAYYHGLPLMELECPYVYKNPRYMLKFDLARWEKAIPSVKYNLVSFGARLSSLIAGSAQVGSYSRCKYCGWISSREVCRVCEIMELAGLLEQYLSHKPRVEPVDVEELDKVGSMPVELAYDLLELEDGERPTPR